MGQGCVYADCPLHCALPGHVRAGHQKQCACGADVYIVIHAKSVRQHGMTECGRLDGHGVVIEFGEAPIRLVVRQRCERAQCLEIAERVEPSYDMILRFTTPCLQRYECLETPKKNDFQYDRNDPR